MTAPFSCGPWALECGQNRSGRVPPSVSRVPNLTGQYT
jgi:hypothetical protein